MSLSTLNSRSRRRNRKTNNRSKVNINGILEYMRPIVDFSHILNPDNMLEPYSLYDYQKECLAGMMEREALYDEDKLRSRRNGHEGIRGGLLALEMGLGKTLLGVTLYILSRILKIERGEEVEGRKKLYDSGTPKVFH